MKLQRLLPLFLFALVAFACNKDNDTDPTIQPPVEEEEEEEEEIENEIDSTIISTTYIQPNNIQPGQSNRYIHYKGEVSSCPYDSKDTIQFTVTNETFTTQNGYVAHVILETLYPDSENSCFNVPIGMIFKHHMYVIPNYNNSLTDYLVIEPKQGFPSLFMLPTNSFYLPLANFDECEVEVDAQFPLGTVMEPGCSGTMYATDVTIQDSTYAHLNYLEQIYFQADVEISMDYSVYWNVERGLVYYPRATVVWANLDETRMELIQ